MNSINICICTCQREQLLKQCLESIAAIHVPENLQITVTIVDNDKAESARPVVASYELDFPFPVRYVVESRRGIPCARNRAIDETHGLGSEYLVFIDDDEWVQPEWLALLYEYCIGMGGRVVVSGDVVAELPPDTPQDLKAVFEPKHIKTGSRLSSCATNNVLIPVYVTRELGLRFNELNPLAGGTDTMFFVEAVERGVDIVRLAEALVHETIPASRANFRWLAKRKYRAGLTDAWCKRRRGRTKAQIIVSAVALVLLESVKGGVMTVAGNKPARTRFLLKACKYAGVAAGAFGARLDSYKIIDN